MTTPFGSVGGAARTAGVCSGSGSRRPYIEVVPTKAIAVCALLTLCTCGGSEAPRWPGAALRHLLSILDSAQLTGEEHLAVRAEAAAKFEGLVESGGLALVDEAVACMLTGDERDRRNAQLILAAARDVPPERLARLEASGNLLVSLYPAIRAREVADGDVLSREDLYRTGVQEPDPLCEVAPEILARLLPADDPEPPDVKAEYAVDWRNRIKPRLLEFWRHIPQEDRWIVDFDRDGQDEVFVAARDLAGTYWWNDFRFLAILRRQHEGWKLVGFRRLEQCEEVHRVVVGDFDLDGCPDVAVWTHLIGGYSYGYLTVFCRDRPDGVRLKKAAYRPSLDVPVVMPKGGRPLFTLWNYHLPTDGPKLVESGGVLAYKCSLFMWDADHFEPLGQLWLPLRH